MFPGGEIRGFLLVPEPATIALDVVGGIAFILTKRGRGA